ncbi:MAG: carboxypeptidase regulatory-like domain-containing protein [Cytophagales bacterium]|nr:carboxypeptidase regulatory-like domain-containing protein [Armatimonadota bacterium]
MKFALISHRLRLQAAAIAAIIAALFLPGAAGLAPVYAQATRAGAAPRVPTTKFPGLGSTRFLPRGITQRSLVGVRGFDKDAGKTPGASQTRAQLGGENGFDVPEKVVNVTRQNASDEIHPFWSADETALYFAGNASFQGTGASDGYQLYRVASNPSGGTVPTATIPIRLTNEANADYLFPVLSTAGNRIAFSRRRVFADGTRSPYSHLYVALNPSNPVEGVPSSFIPSIPDGNNLISLTYNPDDPTAGPQEARGNRRAIIGGRFFVEVGRAAFTGASRLVFAARLSAVGGGGTPTNFHLFSVDLNTLEVRQLTDGTADEQNPAVSPDGRYIAFDSNATPSANTYSAGTPAISNTPQQRRNIFTVDSQGQNATNPITLFSFSNASGNDFDNIQPAWSRLDRNSFSNPDGSNYYLTYASNRRLNTTTNTYAASPTYDVFYKIATATATGAATLLAESASSLALRLDTADDTGAFNDEYPTFPPLLNALRIGFQSDRVGELRKANFPTGSPGDTGFVQTSGIHDLFVATLIDLNAPTLLRWDSGSDTGEIVHINAGTAYDSSPTSAIRNRDQGLTPGTEVFFTVRAEDLESGIDSVYIQFKNPNSRYQSLAQGGGGVEHKEYDPGIEDALTSDGDDESRFAFINYEPVPTGGFRPFQWQAGQSFLPNPSNVGREYEAEAINAGNRTSYLNHRRNRLNRTGPLPIPGEDDIPAFSGGAFLATYPTIAAPTGSPGVWLKLELLPDTDQQKPLPGGPGGRLYGASWKVPDEASDWYMDVILFDTAANPFAPGRSNWIIYDNVWGFSTAASLSPQAVDVLVVMDYALGQKFFKARFGQPGATFGRGTNNLPNIQYGVESYYTDPEYSRYPDGQPAPFAPGSTTVRQWDTLGPFGRDEFTLPSPTGANGGAGIGTPNPLGVNSYIDSILESDATPFDGRTLPSVGRYSMWRVLSRGPVPTNLLTDYLPVRSTSPPDQFLNAQGTALETTPRTVLQANRIVVWASPFTANVFTGAGSITDQQTQDNLRNYVNQGGRLFLSGQDIAFALAGNGQANTFVVETLKAGFINDSAGGVTTIAAVGNTPINGEPFGTGAQHAYVIQNGQGTSPYSRLGSEALEIATVERLPFEDLRGDASPASSSRAGLPFFNGYLDVITPLAGATTEFSLGGGAGMVSSTSAGGGRVAFASFGFEAIGNGYFTYTIPNNTTQFVSNRGRRAELMHNIVCAFRSGTITGRLLDQNGSPVNDALVRAIRDGAAENQPAAGTGYSDGNGNWTIQGLEPGFYQVIGYRAGFYTQKSTGETLHGASRSNVNLVLRKAGPGGLTGIQNPTTGRNSGGVFRSDNVTPIPNITVLAYRTDAGVAGPRLVGYTAKTSDGTLSVEGVVLTPGQYSFGTQLPIGDYVVIANPSQIVDGNGQLVDNPDVSNTFTKDVRVTTVPPQPAVTLGPGTTVVNNLVNIGEGATAQIDFRLGSSPQPVAGKVVDTDGQPVAGVTVTGVLLNATPAVVVVQSAAPTNASGDYTLVTVATAPATPVADIPEGTYILTGTRAGYQQVTPPTVQIQVGGAGTLTAPNIVLRQLAPGQVSGLVTGGSAGTTPITGAVVTLIPVVNGAPVDDPNGNPTATTTAVVTEGTGAAAYRFNYRFTAVPAGQYVAVVRFNPAGNAADALALVGTPNPSAIFTVTESTETRNINFVLRSLQTYPAGLQMISLPNDYSGVTPYQVFNLAPENDNNEDGTVDQPDVDIFNIFTVANYKEDQTGYELFGQRFLADATYNANLRFLQGTGYFVRFGRDTGIALGGRGEASNTFSKTLPVAGWYILGNPFGSVTQSTVQATPLNLTTDITFSYTANGVTQNQVLLSQAVSDGVVQQVVFDFTGSNNGSQYRQTQSLLPFFGYWFRSYVPMTLQFNYPAAGPTRAAGQTAAAGSGKVTAAMVAEMMKASKAQAALKTRSQGGLHRSVSSKGLSDWRLQIAARQGDLVDTDNTVGVAPGAKDGFDTGFDTVKPPMMSQDKSLYLTIDGTDERGRSASSFSDNIRASGGGKAKTWEFTVQTTSEQEVTLYWPNVNRLPRNLDPVLVDIQSGKRVSLRNGASSYRYQPQGRSAQHFRIEINPAASRPLALTNVKTSRVPGRSQGGAGNGYRFSFTATQEADVTAEVQDPRGRTVRRMQTRAQASRESAFVWDGRSENGGNLAAGPYFITLTARDATTGALVRTRVPIITVR